MNKYKHSKAGLFLMEIMLNILFFSILVTICLQLFFKAHNLSESTTTQHRAVTTCCSIAEIYQSAGEGEDAILSVYSDGIYEKDQITLYFDEEFISCTENEAAYRATITLGDSLLHTALIEFYKIDSTEMLYTLSVSSYQQTLLSSVAGGDVNE